MRFLPLQHLLCTGLRAATPDLRWLGGTVFPAPDAAPIADAVVVILQADPRTDDAALARVQATGRAGKFMHREM